jgi:hypothetical protein
VSAVAPQYPAEDALWLDVSVSPSQLKCWNGTSWEAVDDQTDLINAIEEVQNQVDGLSVGGVNLINETGDDPVTITANTTLAVLDLSTYKNAWDGWLTFRAKLSPTTGTWKLRIKFTATAAAQATLGNLILGSGVTDVTANEVINIDSDTCTTEQWLTITTQIQSTNFVIEPQIILVSNSGETTYQYPKFELGNLPTHWAPSNDDISNQFAQASIDLEAVRTEAYSYIDDITEGIDAHIALLVPWEKYNENNEIISDGITALRTDINGISADVAEIDRVLGPIGTHITVTTEGMSLKQDQSANYEAFLTAETLSFRHTSGEAVAQFGVSGCFAKKL